VRRCSAFQRVVYCDAANVVAQLVGLPHVSPACECDVGYESCGQRRPCTECKPTEGVRRLPAAARGAAECQIVRLHAGGVGMVRRKIRYSIQRATCNLQHTA
jgi:hypothetical protein